jgi:hypothetical protein
VFLAAVKLQKSTSRRNVTIKMFNETAQLFLSEAFLDFKWFLFGTHVSDDNMRRSLAKVHAYKICAYDLERQHSNFSPFSYLNKGSEFETQEF